jgi:hypothetical protein
MPHTPYFSASVEFRQVKFLKEDHTPGYKNLQ